MNQKKKKKAKAQIHDWTEELMAIRNKSQEFYFKLSGRKVEFQVMLANLYKDGESNIYWHADREELGKDTPIFSISLGTERVFKLRLKDKEERKKNPKKTEIKLTNDCCVIMENFCQHK